jgi:hypothetical protein
MEFELIHGDLDKPEGFVVYYTSIISEEILPSYRAAFGMPFGKVVSENPRLWVVREPLDIEEGVPDAKRPISMLRYFEEENRVIDKLKKVGGWDIYKSKNIYLLSDSNIDPVDQELAEHSYDYVELYYSLIDSRRENDGDLPNSGLEDIPGWGN